MATPQRSAFRTLLAAEAARCHSIGDVLGFVIAERSATVLVVVLHDRPTQLTVTIPALPWVPTDGGVHGRHGRWLGQWVRLRSVYRRGRGHTCGEVNGGQRPPPSLQHWDVTCKSSVVFEVRPSTTELATAMGSVPGVFYDDRRNGRVFRTKKGDPMCFWEFTVCRWSRPEWADLTTHKVETPLFQESLYQFGFSHPTLLERWVPTLLQRTGYVLAGNAPPTEAKSATTKAKLRLFVPDLVEWLGTYGVAVSRDVAIAFAESVSASLPPAEAPLGSDSNPHSASVLNLNEVVSAVGARLPDAARCVAYYVVSPTCDGALPESGQDALVFATLIHPARDPSHSQSRKRPKHAQ